MNPAANRAGPPAGAPPTVSCLTEDLPYTAAAAAFVSAAQALSLAPFGCALRAAICYELFHATEQILGSDADPVPPFIAQLERHTALLRASAFPHGTPTSIDEAGAGSVEEVTGKHYGALFQAFDAEHYCGEAEALLRTRLERGGFDLASAQGGRALDAGCGGGRYTVALRRLGFEQVLGLDLSTTGLATARERLEALPTDGIAFEAGSVLDIPAPDGAFDFVFSNGVLHHTTDPAQGLHELLRVLRPGGRGFLYLIERPGGIFWDSIELLRVLMHGVPQAFARANFSLFQVPANRRFYILDHIMVPINIRMTPAEVEAALGAAGATEITRLTRGTDFDRIEQIHQQRPHARTRYGVGENRYLFRRGE